VKILILTQYYPPEIGGPQTRLAAMAAELRTLGHSIEVVTSIPNYPRGKFFQNVSVKPYQCEIVDGVTVHRVWMYPAMGSGMKRLLSYLSFTLCSLIGLSRTARPDYMFVESPPLFLSVPAIAVARLRNSRIVLNVSDVWPDAIAQGGFMSRGFAFRCLESLERWSYRHSDYVNAVTEGIRNSLSCEKGVPEGKVLFLPNGVDTRLFRPLEDDSALRTRLGLTGKKIFLWAGTLGFAHGLDNVLRAAESLRATPDIHFLFVGDGSAKPKLKSLAKTLNLPNVTFVPPVSTKELASYFSIATAGLASLLDIPLHEGARPSKIFPVLASAKPLIFVGRGECARLVEQSGAGIIVPAGDPTALAAGVVELAENPELAASLGARGREYVKENFQWTSLISAWVRQLELRGVQPPAAERAINLS
jgi:colanic acid biosynthesis glycosyl transferase WcaI